MNTELNTPQKLTVTGVYFLRAVIDRSLLLRHDAGWLNQMFSFQETCQVRSVR